MIEEKFFSTAIFITSPLLDSSVFSGTTTGGCNDTACPACRFVPVNHAIPVIHRVKAVRGGASI